MRRAAVTEDASLRRQAGDAEHIVRRIENHLKTSADAAGEHPHLPMRPAIQALTAATRLVVVVERWRCKLVRLARDRGAKWSDIGRALGVSKQAAHEHYHCRTAAGPELPGR
jgi:hypothetical protein